MLRGVLRIFWLIPALAFYACMDGLKAQEHFGIFRGELIVKTLIDGRKLQLTHPFSFVDPTGKLWAVPAGKVVDGASIPPAFWSIIGGPFEDKYREASVIHDHYCDEKTDTWQNVHLVFYNGMRAHGVDPLKAKLMYAAVYNFGPRWLEVRPGDKATLISGQPILLESAKEAIVKFISESDPSLAAIRDISDKLAEVESIDQLEKILYENAKCTPILTKGLSTADVKRTLVLCGLSKNSKRQAALRNLRTLVHQLRELLNTQSIFLLPATRDYASSPTPERWNTVKEFIPQCPRPNQIGNSFRSRC